MPVVESAGSQEASEVQSTKDKSGESPTVQQNEAATPESAPVSNQPVSTVISEEVPSVSLAEIPPSQTPTDTGVTDHPCCSSQSKVSIHVLFHLWSSGASSEEPSETKQVPSQPIPEVYTLSLEPEPAQADYTEAAPAEVASLDSEPSGNSNQFCGKLWNWKIIPLKLKSKRPISVRKVKAEGWELSMDLVSLVLSRFSLCWFLLSACSSIWPTTWSHCRKDGSRTQRYKPTPDTLRFFWDFSAAVEFIYSD